MLSFLSVGVATHIFKYNGINKRNAVGIHVYFLSVLKDNILAQVIINDVMVRIEDCVTVDAVNASNVIEHF